MSAIAQALQPEMIEPEADETLYSPEYQGRVLAAAIRLVKWKLRVGLMELGVILKTSKTTLSRYSQGAPVKPRVFELTMRQLEDIWQERRIG